VTVCRDAAKGKCTRSMCKYYHIPTLGSIPQATTMMQPVTSLATNMTYPYIVTSTSADNIGNIILTSVP